MVTQQQIKQFLDQQPIAVAGVSRNPKKFGFTAFKEVRDKGLDVIPVNPNSDTIGGVKCFSSVSVLPADVNALWILTPKEKTAAVVKEALDRGIAHIWIQQMSDSPEALDLLNGKSVNLITKECMLMHYKPHSVHKFHRAIKKFFGRLPK